MATTAEVLLDLLTAHGVSTVFGVPGNHTVELYRGFASRDIRHVTCRHEQGAAFMADGYARATGRPGVCVLISGPGLLNAATALAQSLADSVPLLVITGVAAIGNLGMARGTLHELPDQRASAASFCRSSRTLLDPENLPGIIDQAFCSFSTSRPGPAHIEIPLDLMTAELATATVHSRSRIGAPGPDPALIDSAAELISSALTPLLLVGGGARGAADEIRNLSERLDCPVLNTTNGKGIVPADHPLAVGGSPSLPCLRRALAEADVVLAVGTEMGETDYDLLMAGPPVAPASLIRMDIDPRQLLIPEPPTLGITTDAALGVRALTTALLADCCNDPARSPASGPDRARLLREQVRSEGHYHPEMQAFFESLQRSAPNAVIVGDSTRPTYYAAWQLECQNPRSYFHSVSGFGTLGYALPAASGACLGSEGSVIALIGDGGIQFTLPELTTAAELGLSVAVIVWHNDGYREIENSMQAKGVAADSTLILAPDFEAAAQAHHAAYAHPESLAALEAAVEAAHRRAGPTLIEVREADFLKSPSGGWYQREPEQT